MKGKRNISKLAFLAIILLLLIATVISGWGKLPAFAERYVNTDVLEDLKKDEKFDVKDYPARMGDYSISVIQIAESTAGELFLYTYQPSQRTKYLEATQINMSLNQTADGTRLYELKLINVNGVFCKYAVKGVTVSDEAVRFYNITSIYRLYDKHIDSPTDNDNEFNSVYNAVEKIFKVETVGGTVKYTCKATEVVEIKNPFVDFISYGTSSGWDIIFDVVNWTDIHYIAFSADKKIETLKEADVTYTTQTYHYTGKNNEGYTYGEKSDPQYTSLTGKEEIGVDGYPTYTWKSIYRSEEFVKTTNLTGEAKTNVEKSEFVLVFLKTSFKEQEKWSMMQGHYKEADGTKVSNVSILRLNFETDGVAYNLGVLMNQQEGDDIAGNKPDNIGFWAYIWRCIVRLFTGTATLNEKIIAIVVIAIAVLFLPVLLTVLSLVFPAFRAVMKIFLKGLWYIISAPFKGIVLLIKGLVWIICLPFKGIGALIKRKGKSKIKSNSKSEKK